MKPKHLAARIAYCLSIAECSTCPRRKFGAVLFDPVRNIDVCSGYNGPPRGAAGSLCGSHFSMPFNPTAEDLVDVCDRDHLQVPSGTRLEVGCHHAEANTITNAARRGVATEGCHLIVTGEPCLSCAKLTHHAGITKVYCVKGGYKGGDSGVSYLREHNVTVEYVDGPQDPRSAA